MKNIKKKIITIVFIFFASVAFSQSLSLLDKKFIKFNVLGINKFGKSYLPSFDVGIEYGIHKNVTVGAMFLCSTNFKDTGLYSVLINGDYHFNSLFRIPSSFDLYTGLSLGYAVYIEKPKQDVFLLPLDLQQRVHSAAIIFPKAGCRYFFNKSWGIGLEYYYIYNHIVNIGVTYRF